MQQKKWGFWVLTAFVVGNMVGAGIFMVPSTLAQTPNPVVNQAKVTPSGLAV
ncbi:hypothetical protein ACT4UM_12620, partial [Bacillus sp. SS-TM]